MMLFYTVIVTIAWKNDPVRYYTYNFGFGTHPDIWFSIKSDGTYKITVQSISGSLSFNQLLFFCNYLINPLGVPTILSSLFQLH
jgi:hypothetical protein